MLVAFIPKSTTLSSVMSTIRKLQLVFYVASGLLFATAVYGALAYRTVQPKDPSGDVVEEYRAGKHPELRARIEGSRIVVAALFIVACGCFVH